MPGGFGTLDEIPGGPAIWKYGQPTVNVEQPHAEKRVSSAAGQSIGFRPCLAILQLETITCPIPPR